MADIETHPEKIDFRAEFKLFIDDRKRYIEEKAKEFESKKRFLVGTAVPSAIQDCIDSYRETLKALESSEKQVVDMFSLGNLSKSMERHRAYPPAISAHHNRKMLLTLGIIGAGVATAGLFAIGGTNPITWTPTLQGVAIATGLSLGGFVAVPIRISDWRGFDRNKVDSRKFNFIEKRIMKRVKTKERALSQISLEIGQNMLPILKGECTIDEIREVTRKRFILFGKEKPHNIIDLKDKYKLIPKRKRKKLLKIISKSKGLIEAARTLEDSLNFDPSKNVIITESLNKEKNIPAAEAIQQPVQPKINNSDVVDNTIEQVVDNAKGATPTKKATQQPAQQPVETKISNSNTSEKAIFVPPLVSKAEPKSRSFNSEEMKMEAKDFFKKDELELFSSIATDFKSLKDGKLDLSKSDFSQRFVQLMLDIDDKRAALKDLPNLNLFLSECNTELKKHMTSSKEKSQTSSKR